MGEKESNLEEVKKSLSEDEICFIYYMVRYEHENRKIIKPVLINFQPKGGSQKDKIVYTSLKLFMKNKLTGVNLEYFCESMDLLTEEQLNEFVGKSLKN